MIRLAIHAAAVAAMLAVYAVSPRAHAAGLCIDAAGPKGAIVAHGGKWTEMTPGQWQFLRGVFVLNPNTPPGLPYGSSAALAQVDGDRGGLVFFMDDGLACTPMAVPQGIVEMLGVVGVGTISHEGTEN